MMYNTLGINVYGMIEGALKKLSDKRKVGGVTWADLRERAMKENYKKRPLYM